ncbi:hypothetical protein J7E91_12845 [Streptomyces sp. ISL-99]|uniref:hypothetical protein n=1 Tax=Streptomyces sp. ISL-99 TaxID=2819193 RepID=UPI001BE6241A|nr:hypothetical protein [Streptomyces sp. ISL-99]MBT2526307.1 hypothetical protein [Streptomyces sp. ISL-99]
MLVAQDADEAEVEGLDHLGGGGGGDVAQVDDVRPAVGGQELGGLFLRVGVVAAEEEGVVGDDLGVGEGALDLLAEAVGVDGVEDGCGYPWSG